MPASNHQIVLVGATGGLAASQSCVSRSTQSQHNASLDVDGEQLDSHCHLLTSKGSHCRPAQECKTRAELGTSRSRDTQSS